MAPSRLGMATCAGLYAVSHLLLVGEMGGELGHLATLSALAAALVQRGDRVTVAVNHLARAAPLSDGA